MKVLFLGDVVGRAGCEFVSRHLRSLKKLYGVDACVINGENSAEGNGITPDSARMLFDAGADVITTGNHVLKRREIYPVLEEENGIIRPANYHPSVPGSGMFILDKLRWQLCVINLQGQMGMEVCANPFERIDQLLKEVRTPNILVDFHAEMTSEKKALGYYLDGRVSAVIGTHTHVQTADERILPGLPHRRGDVRRQKLGSGCQEGDHSAEIHHQYARPLRVRPAGHRAKRRAHHHRSVQRPGAGNRADLFVRLKQKSSGYGGGFFVCGKQKIQAFALYICYNREARPGRDFLI